MANANMAYALKKSGKTQDQYISDLWNRVGTTSANTGKTLTQNDIYSELKRLGENPYTYNDAQGNQFMYSNGQKYALGSTPMNQEQNARNSAVYNEYQKQLARQNANFDEQNAYNENIAEQQRKQAWLNQQQNQRKLREYLASTGLNGSGYAESSYLGMLGDYATELSNIDNALAQQRMQTNQDRTNAQNQYGMAMAQYLDNYLQNEEAKSKEAEQLAYTRSMQDYQNAYNEQLKQQQAQQQEYENALRRAQIKLNMGIIDDDVQMAYGITPQQYNAYMQQQLAQQMASSSKKKVSSDGGGGDEYVNYDVKAPSVSTPQQATQWLKDIGITTNDGDKAHYSFMTESEFARHMNTNSTFKKMQEDYKSGKDPRKPYQQYLELTAQKIAIENGYNIR